MHISCSSTIHYNCSRTGTKNAHFSIGRCNMHTLTVCVCWAALLHTTSKRITYVKRQLRGKAAMNYYSPWIWADRMQFGPNRYRICVNANRLSVFYVCSTDACMGRRNGTTSVSSVTKDRRRLHLLKHHRMYPITLFLFASRIRHRKAPVAPESSNMSALARCGPGRGRVGQRPYHHGDGVICCDAFVCDRAT